MLGSLLPVSDYPFLKQESSAQPTGRGPIPRIRMKDSHPPADIAAAAIKKAIQ